MDVRCVFVWPFILWKVDRWRLLVGLQGPVNPIQSSSWAGKKRRGRGWEEQRGERRDQKTERKKLREVEEVEEQERPKPESPVSESDWALPAVIVSTGGYIPSWLQQAWQSDWFRSSIMAGYECWVWLQGTIKATMADKKLSAPQRSEGPFHACPWAGRAAGSWWPAGSSASRILTPSAHQHWAAGRMVTHACVLTHV